MRRALLLAVAFLVIAAAGVVAFRAHATARLERARAQFEAEAGSLDPASYAPAAVEDSLNVAHWILSGAQATGFAENLPAIVNDPMQPLGSPWSIEDVVAFGALRRELAPARGLMDRALVLEHSSQGMDYTLLAADLPDPLLLLRVARQVLLDCDLALQRGEVETAIADAALLERIAVVQLHEPLIITNLVGGAIERMYHDCLEVLIGSVSLASDLDALDATMRHLERSAAPIGRALAHQGALFFVVQTALMGGKASPLKPSLGDDPHRETGWLRRLLRIDRLVLAYQLEAMPRLVLRAGEPTAGTNAEEWRRREEEQTSRWFPDPVSDMFIPNLIDAIQKEQTTLAVRQLATASLELRRTRLETGVYPSTLASLPVSRFTGETATFERLDDGGIEISFPQSARAWEEGWEGGVPAGARAPNLVWRLPP